VDLIVEGIVLVEIKAVPKLRELHGRVIAYLKATGLRVALLFNFNSVVLKEDSSESRYEVPGAAEAAHGIRRGREREPRQAALGFTFRVHAEFCAGLTSGQAARNLRNASTSGPLRRVVVSSCRRATPKASRFARTACRRTVPPVSGR
jgi:hypothetical protein